MEVSDKEFIDRMIRGGIPYRYQSKAMALSDYKDGFGVSVCNALDSLVKAKKTTDMCFLNLVGCGAKMTEVFYLACRSLLIDGMKGMAMDMRRLLEYCNDGDNIDMLIYGSEFRFIGIHGFTEGRDEDSFFTPTERKMIEINLRRFMEQNKTLIISSDVPVSNSVMYSRSFKNLLQGGQYKLLVPAANFGQI